MGRDMDWIERAIANGVAAGRATQMGNERAARLHSALAAGFLALGIKRPDSGESPAALFRPTHGMEAQGETEGGT